LKRRSVRLLGYTAFAVAALGLAPLAKKAALVGGAAPLPVVVSTAWVAALVVVTAMALRGTSARLVRLGPGQAGAILVVGALGSGLVPLLAVLAMTETSASNRALFQSAYPAATAIAARLLLGERLPAAAYGWIALTCAGLALVNVDFEAAGIGFGWPFWALLATLPLIGLADVVAKRSLSTLSPDVVAAGRAVGGALLLLVVLPVIEPAGWSRLGPSTGWIVLAGVCMGGFALGLYQLFGLTRASIAASLIALAPLVTLAAERVLLDIALRPLQAIGFGTVLAAVLALARRA
jgi:drug/metabolite transporter (DMT)-like permease